MKYKVSVVVPTTGRASLRGSLTSIESQINTDVEILVVDDSDLQSVSMPHGCPGKVIRSGGRAGVSRARNLGIEAATNRWIAFLDDDDEWLPQKINHQIEFMDSNNCDASFTSAYINGESMRPKRIIHFSQSPINQIYGNWHLFKNPFYLPMGSLLYDQSMYSGKFNENFSERENLAFYEDLWRSELKLMQMAEPLVKINYSARESLRRLDYSAESEWLSYLEDYSSQIQTRFILESSRNFIRRGDYRTALKMSLNLRKTIL